tara:strand:+ start:13630 stop:13974 length:345 start_codon:yes stop_codon:yes gene_type:complete
MFFKCLKKKKKVNKLVNDKLLKSKYKIVPFPPKSPDIKRPFIKPPIPIEKRINRPYFKRKLLFNIDISEINRGKDLVPYILFDKSSYIGYLTKNYLSALNFIDNNYVIISKPIF